MLASGPDPAKAPRMISPIPEPTATDVVSALPVSPRALLFFLAPRGNYRSILFSANEVFCGPDTETRRVQGRLATLKTAVGSFDVADVLRELPADQYPEIVVVKADATGRNLPRNLGILRCPKVLLVGDTHHLTHPLRRMIEYARSEPFDCIIFDHTRHHAPFFAEAGLAPLHWLPALDFGYLPRAIPIAPGRPLTFVGQTGRHHPWRRAVLAQVRAAGLPLETMTGTLEQTADIYASSQVTLNVSLNGDLNLRVFEALSAGGFLLTDELAESSGLRMLFEPGRHLDTWRTPGELLDKIRYYLAHPAEAQRIRRAGQEEIRRAHHPEVKLREFYDLVFSGRVNPRYDLSLGRPVTSTGTKKPVLNEPRLAAYEVIQSLHQRAGEVVVHSENPAALADFSGLPRLRLASVEELSPASAQVSGAASVPVLWWEGSAERLTEWLGRFSGRHIIVPAASAEVAGVLAAWGFTPREDAAWVHGLTDAMAFVRAARAAGHVEIACHRLAGLVAASHDSVETLALAAEAEELGDLSLQQAALEQAICLNRANQPALLARAAMALDQQDAASTLYFLEEAARLQPLPAAVDELRASLAGQQEGEPRTASYLRAIGRVPPPAAEEQRRILIVTNLLPPQELGGYGRMMWEFADGLRKRGHAVKALTGDAPYLAKTPTPDEVALEAHVSRSLQLIGEWRGSRPKAIGDPRRRGEMVRENARHVVRAAREFDADLVLAGNLDFLGATLLHETLAAGLPVLHALANATPGYAPAEQPASPRYWVAPCSDWNGQELRRAGFNPVRVETLYPGARIDRFFRLFAPDTRRLRLAYASLVMPYKGVHVLVQALVRLQAAGVDFTAEIAGDCTDPDFLAQLQQTVAGAGLADRVTFTGFLDRQGLGELFARSNVLVFPSQFPEPFGISQVEAMASGLVVVTSGTGGAREIVRHGTDGLLFKADDPAALTEQLCRLAGDPALFSRLQQNGQMRALAFSVESAVRKIEQLAGEMIAAQAAPVPDGPEPVAASVEPPRPMHVMLYTDDPESGGVAQYNHVILRGLVAAGYRVSCVQTQVDNPLITEQRGLGVTHHWIDYHTGRDFARTLNDAGDAERVFASDRPDLIVFSDCCPVSNLAAREVARQKGLPYISVVGFVGAYLADRFKSVLGRLAAQYSCARAVVAVSQENLDLLHNRFGLPASAGQVIHYGRPAKFFAPRDESVRARLRAELNLPEDAVVCFTAARLSAIKGYLYQVVAAKHLVALPGCENLHFVWAGEGEQRPALEQAIASAGLTGRVHPLGHRWDVADWYDAADIFVLPSDMEGMPLAIMEAMAKGLPVVATAVSGIPEELGDTGQLLSAAVESRTALINQLIRTLHLWTRDASLRRCVGEACRLRAGTMFREPLMIERTVQLIRSHLTPSVPAAVPA